jgi:hypothetical protein
MHCSGSFKLKRSKHGSRMTTACPRLTRWHQRNPAALLFWRCRDD